MKRLAVFFVFSTLVAASLLCTSVWVGALMATPSSLWYLGEGGTYTVEPGTNFIVKRMPFTFVFESGPTYQAQPDERVWAFGGTRRVPPAEYDSWEELGAVSSGCVVSYMGIDDDVDGRRNHFYIDDELIHTINEGMVFSGSFIVSRDGRLRLYAGDSAGFWIDSCESVVTPTPPPTAVPTETPPPPTVTPTVDPQITPSPTPLITPTAIIPTETPAATATPLPTATPTKEPRLDSCLRINFEVTGDVAQRGLYVVQEVGGRHLAEWYAEDGWQDSGWIDGIDITFPSVYVNVLYYSGPDASPVVMRIANHAPDTDAGWLSRGMCHALEVGWP